MTAEERAAELVAHALDVLRFRDGSTATDDDAAGVIEALFAECNALRAENALSEAEYLAAREKADAIAEERDALRNEVARLRHDAALELARCSEDLEQDDDSLLSEVRRLRAVASANLTELQRVCNLFARNDASCPVCHGVQGNFCEECYGILAEEALRAHVVKLGGDLSRQEDA